MRAISLLFIAFLLTACAPAQATALPSSTPAPSQTAAATTAASTATSTTIPSPTATNTPAEPEPEIIAITIAAPGPDSQVLSPIQLQALLQPGPGRLVRTELAGSDGRLLARTLLRMEGIALDYEISFEVREAEAGRLSLSVEDEYGRMRELASVALTLLPPGGAQSIQAPDMESVLIVDSPQEGASISGGVIEVRGEARGSSTRPLTIQVVTRAGRVLATADVYTDAAGADGYSPFAVDLNVAVDEESRVLVVVSRSGGEIPGLWFLYSREVQLLP